MMWAATVRRCPTGQSRHPSQFGARLQLARALNHAPYLICDGSYHFPSTHQNYDATETSDSLRNDYYLVPHDQSDSNLRSDSFRSEDGLGGVLSCYRSRPSLSYGNGPENGQRRSSLGSNFISNTSPVHAMDSNDGSHTDVRVELPYSRREFLSEDYLPGEHFIRRYDNLDLDHLDSRDEDNVVSLSYQQQSIGGSTIYDQEIWGNDLFMDCWDNRRLLIEKGVYREVVKFLGILALSLTLIFFVVIGFGVHNILVTVLFLVLLLSTVLMAIFLVMRKPACASCTEPVDIPGNTSLPTHRNCPGYISNVGGVIKKNLTDSPPPYEFPPDYESLPPELLVSAISLQEMNCLPDGANHQSKPNSTQQTARRFIFRSSRETIPKESNASLQNAASPVPEDKSSGESSVPLIPPERTDKLSKDSNKPPPTYDCVIKMNDKVSTSPSKQKT